MMSTSIGLSLISFAILAACSNCGHERIGEYEAPDEFRVVVYAERCYERAQSVYYEVRRNKEVVVSRTWFQATENQPKDTEYSVLAGKDETVFGLVGGSGRKDVYMIFELRSNTSWPKREANETGFEAAVRGERLLSLLRESVGDQSLRIAD